jgi:hypothetical protein
MSNEDRVIFLNKFRTIPWQIIEALQQCHDKGDDAVKAAAIKAGEHMERHLRMMERIWIDRSNISIDNTEPMQSIDKLNTLIKEIRKDDI